MRAVTERDFRKKEFLDAKTEDYEFREDGNIVRKDRWENGIRIIAGLMGFGGHDAWEIEEVVERVKKMSESRQK